MCLATAAICPSFSVAALAQTYPARPVKVIVPNSPGSGIDVLARVITQQLASRLGQPFIIENKPGAGTTLGTRDAARAAPDGYSLFIGSIPTLAISATLYPNAGYDPVRSFAPVASLAGSPFFLVVHPEVSAKTLQGFIDLAKAPGKINFGYGLGTHPQFVGEYFKIVTGVNIVSISYRSSAQALTDLLGGRIQMNVSPPSTLLPFIRKGDVRVLAFTGSERSPDLPDVPTMSECGFPQLTTSFWGALLAPAGAPEVILDKLLREVNAILALREVKTALTNLGLEAQSISSREALTERIGSEALTWPPVVQVAGLKPE